MANKKGLQQQMAPPVQNNAEYLLSELQDRIQNQNISIQQSVSDLVSEGNNPQEIAEVLLGVGYSEEDIGKLFSSLQKSQQDSEVERNMQQPQQERPMQQPQIQKQKVQQMQREGVVAKKGGSLPKARMGFKDWMRGATKYQGNINQNEMYQAPEARYLPMKKSNYSTFDAVTNIASDVLDSIDTVKGWDENKESFYKYNVKTPEGVDIKDYATNAKELYKSATQGTPLRTRENLKQDIASKSRMGFDPKRGYFTAFADPYSTQKQRDKMMKKKLGKDWRSKSIPFNEVQDFDYDQSQAVAKYLSDVYAGKIPMGALDYDLLLGQKQFNTTQENLDKSMQELYSRQTPINDWWKKLGGSTNDKYQSGREIPTIRVGFGSGNDTDIKTSDGGFGAMLDQDVDEYYDDQNPTVSFQNKPWGDFLRGMDMAGDMAEATVNTVRNVNTILENADYNKQLADITHQAADGIYGIDDPGKGNYTVLDGTLQPNRQTPWAQAGMETGNKNTKNLSDDTLDRLISSVDSTVSSPVDTTATNTFVSPHVLPDRLEKSFGPRIKNADKKYNLNRDSYWDDPRKKQGGESYLPKYQAQGSYNPDSLQVLQQMISKADTSTTGDKMSYEDFRKSEDAYKILSAANAHQNAMKNIRGESTGRSEWVQRDNDRVHRDNDTIRNVNYNLNDEQINKILNNKVLGWIGGNQKLLGDNIDSYNNYVKKYGEDFIYDLLWDKKYAQGNEDWGNEYNYNDAFFGEGDNYNENKEDEFNKRLYGSGFGVEDINYNLKDHPFYGTKYKKDSRKQQGGNPFSTKRQLRKKRGGQVASISTEILKKLQATKGAKFDVL